MNETKQIFLTLAQSLLEDESGISGESYNALLDLAAHLGVDKSDIGIVDATDDRFYYPAVGGDENE